MTGSLFRAWLGRVAAHGFVGLRLGREVLHGPVCAVMLAAHWMDRTIVV